MLILLLWQLIRGIAGQDKLPAAQGPGMAVACLEWGKRTDRR